MEKDGCWPRVVRRTLSGIRRRSRLLFALLLGQVLSLLLCGTGVTSQLLEQNHSLSVPTTQAFINYALLAGVFGVTLATRSNFLTILRQNWWKYLLLGLIDVEANYLIILAYKYTNLTSIQLLDSFTIACVMVLSFIFLRVRFKLINFVGVILSLIGILSLILEDSDSPCNRTKGTNQLIGDLLCLGGSALYALSNVAQEFLVKHHSITEYLGMLGVSGSVISAIQLLLIERSKLVRVEWSQDIGLLFGGFGFSLFLFYSVMPHVMKHSSAVVVNLSLLTADVYTLFIGLFVFHCKFSLFYVMALILIILGVLIYNLKPPGVAKTTKAVGNQQPVGGGGTGTSVPEQEEGKGEAEVTAEDRQHTEAVERKGLLHDIASLPKSLDSTIRNSGGASQAVGNGEYDSYYSATMPIAASVYSDCYTQGSSYDNQDKTYERLEESYSSSSDEADHEIFLSGATGPRGRRLSASIRRQSKAGVLNYGTTAPQPILPATPPEPPFPFYQPGFVGSGLYGRMGESDSEEGSDSSEEVVTVHLERTEVEERQS